MGGGDSGYEQQQQQTEANKQKARDALNALFGVGSNDTSLAASLVGPAPTRSQYVFDSMPGYTVDSGENSSSYVPASSGQNDEAGYQKALADYNAQVQAKQNELTSTAQNRDALYQEVRDNAYNAGKRELDENQANAARKLKFELFATGQNGGSNDIDENALLKRTYDKGILDLGAKADAAKADFQNADQNTRLQLLQSIDNGMDQGSALSQAAASMQTAADKAAADASGTSLGDLFATAGLLYDQSQLAKGRLAAQQTAYSLFPQKVGATSTTGTVSGVTTRLPGE